MSRVKCVVGIIGVLVAQATGTAQSMAIRAGQNFLPGNYAALRYEHFTNTAINLSGGVFLDASNKNGLRYHAYGIELLAQYTKVHSSEDVFGYRLGLGGCAQIESEPWIYGNLPPSQKANYGIAGEASLEWWMSTNFCLSVFGQQKYLLRSSFGNTRFVAGLGLHFRFDNF